jgi:metal-responsive CopG/Arc/MetJ family transcriptional regulator
VTRRTVRTTVAIPADLLAAADEAVRNGWADSRNELLAAALQRELAARQRALIDAAFADWAKDEEEQAETEALLAEFAKADWEAWQLAESEE